VIEDALIPMHPKNNPFGAGILRGDKWDDIVGWSDRFDIDKINPRVEVTIREVETDGEKAQGRPDPAEEL